MAPNHEQGASMFDDEETQVRPKVPLRLLLTAEITDLRAIGARHTPRMALGSLETISEKLKLTHAALLRLLVSDDAQL